MIVLAVDTASPLPAAALTRTPQGADPAAGETLSSPLGERAAERLPGQVQYLLDQAGLKAQDLDRVAVLTGPGSFTGLRAGAAFCRGLARALDIPLFAFPTFVVASSLVPDPPDADFILDAGRGEVQRAVRRSGAVGPPSLVRREEAIRLAEAAGARLVDLDALGLPLASAAASLAAVAPLEAATDLVTPLGYGRPSAAEERFGPPGRDGT